MRHQLWQKWHLAGLLRRQPGLKLPVSDGAKLGQCPDFGARHLCRFTMQSNQGVEAGQSPRPTMPKLPIRHLLSC
jgi:hypothetical protein